MACEIYEQILKRNLLGTFDINEYCEMVYMIEIKHDGSRWGATPRFFYDKEEAKEEAETLRTRYPFIYDCRVVTRRMTKKSIRA